MTTALQRATAPQIRLSWFDRLLINIAPDWGLRRVRARAMARHYEAAQVGRRTSGWQRFSSDANAASGPALTALRELSRDLMRNNGWAQSGVETIVNNTVGWGIVPKADTRAARPHEVWKAWADSAACDFDGRLNFVGLEALAMRTIVESGEVLILKQPAATVDGLPVPLRIQVLEPDYLDTSRHAAMGLDGTTTIDGIEFDKQGRRVAYWLHVSHPGGVRVANARFGSVRTPASEVLHIYRVNRPGQMRGVAWLASAISKIKDLDDFEDAELMQQKVAACFAAFVTNVDGSSPIAVPGTDEDGEGLEQIEPGHIAYLSPGEQVTFAQPPGTRDAAFSERTLRRIAASLGVTYEDLTGDYSKVNFSSARMARLAHWQRVHVWRWQMFIPGFCGGVWRWVMELAAQIEGWPEVPGAQWSAPPMPILEPDKEGLAYQRLVRNGAMTWPQMIRELGEDPDAQLEEIQKFNAQVDKLGIALDCDPRKTTASGQQQSAGQSAGSSSDVTPKFGKPKAVSDDPADETPADEVVPEEETPAVKAPAAKAEANNDKGDAMAKDREAPKVFAYHQPFMKVKEIRDGIGLAKVEDDDLFAGEFVAKHGGASVVVVDKSADKTTKDE